MKQLYLLPLLLLAAISLQAQRPNNPFASGTMPGEAITYRNPVIPGFYSDPSVCRVGEDYYLVTSTFGYFPGVPVFHSKDLVHWEQIGHCIDRKEQLPRGLNIYASTIRYHDGLFYMITTNVGYEGNFYVTATNPAGPWSDPIRINLPGIDPDLFFDDDGKVYAISSSFVLYQVDSKSGKFLSEGRQIWWGTGGRYAEGPHIYKKDGYYYLMAAEGGTEEAHSETIARSNRIEGPYIPNPANPILAHANAAGQSSPIQGVGHADLIQAHDGSFWMVHHGYRKVVDYPVHHILGRETCLAPVSWPKNGWPVINGNGVITVNMSSPVLAQKPFQAPSERITFPGPQLGLEWNFIQYPSPFYSFEEGALRIVGAANRIGEKGASPAFIGRRLQHHQFTATTRMRFEPKNANEEAGLSLVQEDHHFDLLVKRSGSRRVVYAQLQFGSIVHKSKEVPLEKGAVDLQIACDKGRFVFCCAQNGSFTEIESVDARYLSTEVVGGFTGVYVGFYATGNGNPSQTPALFDSFVYAPLD